MNKKTTLKKLFDDAYDSEIKRLYVPYEIEQVCQKCNAKLVTSFWNDEPFMTEGDFGKVYEHSNYCDKCEDRTGPSVKIRADVVLTIVEDENG